MKKVVAAVLALTVVAAVVMLPSWNSTTEATYQGWIEADLIFVSPDEAGRIETMTVREGDNVEDRALLFTLDDALQRADVNQVEATLTNARQALDRAQQLLRSSAGTQRAYDEAEAAVRNAEARLNSAQTRLARRRMASPVAGIVQQVYFRQGELVPAGRPVLAILPPANVKVRFFVPEPALQQVALNEKVRVRCDGCDQDLMARVSFISRTAEYTPPVIYSLEERSKLVFLVEARPEHPEKLRVGQPVTVALAAPHAQEAKR